MSRLVAFVTDNLTESEREAIIASYEKFVEDGYIGDEPIRTYSRMFVKSLGITGDQQITLWMDRLAMECYRHYYKQQKASNENSTTTRQAG